MSLGKGKVTQTHEKTQKLNQNPSQSVGKVGLKQGPGRMSNLYQQQPQAAGKETLANVADETHDATRRPIQHSSRKNLERYLRRKRYLDRARINHRNRRLEWVERQKGKQEVAQGRERLQEQRRNRYLLRQERLHAKSRDNSPRNGLGGKAAGCTSSQQKIFPSRDQPLLQHETLHRLPQDDNKESPSPRRRSLEQEHCTEAKTHQRRSERIGFRSAFPDQQHLWASGKFNLPDTQYHRQRGYLVTRGLQNGSEYTITSDDSNKHFKQPPIVEIAANLKSKKIQRRMDQDRSPIVTSERSTSGSSYEEQQQLQKLAPARVPGQWTEEESVRWIPMKSKFIIVRRRRSPLQKQHLESPQRRQDKEEQEAESAHQSTMLHTVVWPKGANNIPPTKFRVELVGESIPEVYRVRRIQRPLHQGRKSFKETQQHKKMPNTRQRTNSSLSTQRVRQKQRLEEGGRHERRLYKQSEDSRSHQRRSDRTTRGNTSSSEGGTHCEAERHLEDSIEMRMIARSTSGSSYEEEIEAYRLDSNQVQPGKPITAIPTRDRWNVNPDDTPGRWLRTWVRTQQRHRRPNTSKSAEQSKRRLLDKDPQTLYVALWRAKQGAEGFAFRQHRPPQYFRSKVYDKAQFNRKLIEDAERGRKDIVVQSKHRPEFFRYHRTRRPLRKGGHSESLNEPKGLQAVKSPQTEDFAQMMNAARLQDEREASRWVVGPSKDKKQGQFIVHRLKRNSAPPLHRAKSLEIPQNMKTFLVPKEQQQGSASLGRLSGTSKIKREQSDGDQLQRRRVGQKTSSYGLDAMYTMSPFSSSPAQLTLHQRRAIEWPPLHTVVFQGKNGGTRMIPLIPKTRIEQSSRPLEATQPGIKLVSSLSKIESPRAKEPNNKQQQSSMADVSTGPVQKHKNYPQDLPRHARRPKSSQKKRPKNKGINGRSRHSQSSIALEQPIQHPQVEASRPIKLRKLEQVGHNANLNGPPATSLSLLAPFGLPTKLEVRPPLKFVVTTKMPAPEPIKINSKEYAPSEFWDSMPHLHRRSGQERYTSTMLTQVHPPSIIVGSAKTSKRSERRVGAEHRQKALQQEEKTQLLLPQASKSLGWKVSQRQLRSGDAVHLRPSSKQETSDSPPQPGRDASQSHLLSPNLAPYQNSPSQLKSLSPHLVPKTPPPWALTPSRKTRSTAKDTIFPKGSPLSVLSFSSSGLTGSSSELSTPDKSISSGASNRPEQAPLEVQKHQKNYQMDDRASDNRKRRPRPQKDAAEISTGGPPTFRAPPVRVAGRRASWRR